MIKDTTFKSPLAEEVQGTVARLLSKENITIHRDVANKTAYFNIQTRVLGLPVFKDPTKDMLDLLIAHEVGHALWTTVDNLDSFMKEFNHHSLYNILEDIRIERLIQREYPGLYRTFRDGYADLVERNFFGPLGKIETFSFLDRLNLFAKAGSNITTILFTEEEQAIVDAALKINTHEELVAVARMIVKFAEEQKTKKTSDKNDEVTSQEESDKPNDDTEFSDDVAQEESDKPNDDTEFSDDVAQEESDKSDDDAESEVKKSSGEKGEDAEQPTLDDTSDADNSQSGKKDDPVTDPLSSEFDDHYSNAMADNTYDTGAFNEVEFISPTAADVMNHVYTYNEVLTARQQHDPDQYGFKSDMLQAEFRQYMIGIRADVTLLRNSFERKKAAYEYSRSTVSSRGDLDTKSLHEFKYNDDIFKTVTNLAQGKSHGLVFMLDFSGSMHGVLPSVIRKTLTLVEFCRMSSIPYEVYTFTSGKAKSKERRMPFTVNMAGLMICNMLSSRMSKSEYKLASFQFHALSSMNLRQQAFCDRLGSTPLINALVASHYLLGEFCKREKVQVPSFMFITDGDGDGGFSFNANPYTVKRIHGRLFKGSRFSMKAMYKDQYTALVQAIHHDHHAHTVGYYLTGDSGFKSIYYGSLPPPAWAYGAAQNFKKDGLFVLQDHYGFESYIIARFQRIYPGAEPTSAFENADTDGKIGAAFAKVCSSSKQNKNFAESFISTICGC